ncbi:2-oxo-4-hydroxy-4-carboxy-5-ureidoimidazoline decarboxylase [Nakamurella sp. YIM 132087]|uniref:2-oxo-4-hydroxy-4-carboxy-5-ureidoimidazoline decarboxylase n=1 Tax=Nakamurella alba TaxID=2665158 RepID=A0A7K1FN47_9ACTN|nr:2-oxo-4-hydroxy-4-carboxy-5-ureidoimidazoline decarboxylase [Nakamurella alba]
MSLTRFNDDSALAAEVLGACLDIPAWIGTVSDGRPYADVAALRKAGAEAAGAITWGEVAGALARHPRIGEKKAATAGTATEQGWSRGEQAGVTAAEVDDLAAGNAAYEARFGHIFLICAAGLSGDEILASLRERLGHSPEDERPVVVHELRRIGELRLAKAVSDESGGGAA